MLKELPAKATKYLLYQNERTNGVVWYVPVGDQVPAHYHPETDDVWIILSGEGDYYIGGGKNVHIHEGMVIPAEKDSNRPYPSASSSAGRQLCSRP